MLDFVRLLLVHVPLFIKAPRPGDNEKTFSFSTPRATCFLAPKYLAQGHNMRTFWRHLFNAECQAGMLWKPILNFGPTQRGNRTQGLPSKGRSFQENVGIVQIILFEW